MKKDIIISGPTASGKSWITEAIEGTHKRKALRVLSESFKKSLTAGIDIDVFRKHSFLIIEECTSDDIIHFDLTISEIPVNKKGENPIPIVYLTQDQVTNQSLGQGHFHIIHCRNAHL